jgi:hypothetical protein
MKSKYLTFAGVIICAGILGFVASGLLGRTASNSPNTTTANNQPTSSNTNAADASNVTVTGTPGNTTISNGTGSAGSGNSSQTVSSAQSAEAVVSGIYAKQMASDAKLKVQYDHMDTVNGQQVYVVHVFDDETGHAATIGWVDVREDGLVQNELLRNGWVSPAQYHP